MATDITREIGVKAGCVIEIRRYGNYVNTVENNHRRAQKLAGGEYGTNRGHTQRHYGRWNFASYRFPYTGIPRPARRLYV